jgi:hypothetical protein
MRPALMAVSQQASEMPPIHASFVCSLAESSRVLRSRHEGGCG